MYEFARTRDKLAIQAGNISNDKMVAAVAAALGVDQLPAGAQAVTEKTADGKGYNIAFEVPLPAPAGSPPVKLPDGTQIAVAPAAPTPRNDHAALIASAKGV